jgi:hypothetical protein
MADGRDDLPLDWPTSEQRTRVDARVRALRHGRLARRSAAAAVVVALVVGLLVVVRGGTSSSVRTAASAPSTTAAIAPVPTTTQPLVGVAEPEGWRLVDYGDARFALPPGWSADGPGSSSCAPLTNTGVTLRHDGPDCAYVSVEPFSQLRELPGRPALTIHGIDLYLEPGSPLWIDYAVPALGLHVYVHQPTEARRVLDTLTLSTRRVVLDSTTWPSVPRDWKTLSFGDVTLSVPPAMNITQLGPNTIAPGACSAVPFPESGAYLGSGAGITLNCPMIPAGVVPVPTDGVWMRPADKGAIPPLPVDRTIRNGRAGLAVKFVPGYGVLDLEPAFDVTILGRDGRRSTTTVRVGLGANPEIARTIIGSMRPAGRSN